MSDDEAQARLDNYLGHMLEAAQLAGQYVQGVSREEFLKDRRTQQAIVLNLMTIGEAAARIVNECKEFAAAHPEIPWAQMRGCSPTGSSTMTASAKSSNCCTSDAGST